MAQDEKKEVKIETPKHVKLVLNLLDILIDGKRFAETDTDKQAYLFDQQWLIGEMKRGWYREESIEYLRSNINQLMNILTAAGEELDKIFGVESPSVNFYDQLNTLTETEHTEIYAELYLKYVGKYTPDNTRIVDVNVDYRKDHQHMNRVVDENGNTYFIEELEGKECQN